MKSLFSFIAILFFLNAQAQDLLQHIGLDELPTDVLCDPPLYLNGFDNVGYFEGELVNDFTLYTSNPIPITLSELLVDKPVILISGSYTCPVFRNKVPLINDLLETYGDLVHIFVVYTIEAHPYGDISPYFGYENPGNANIQQGILYPLPVTYNDRLLIAADMFGQMQIDFAVIFDSPCNVWLEHFGPAPNTCYFIGQDGVVISRHPWFDAYPDDIVCDIETWIDESYECEEDITGGFQFTMDSDTLISGEAGSTISVYGTLYNPTNAPVLIECERIGLDLPLGWSSSMCLDICLQTNEIYREVLLQPGEEQSYTNYFYTTEQTGIGQATIEFRNAWHENNQMIRSFYGEVLDNGISEANVSTPLLYPNPTDGILNLDLLAGQMVRIFSAGGQLVTEFRIDTEPHNIDLSHLPSGLYSVVFTGDGSASKLVIR